MAIVYGANYGRPSLDLNFAKNKSLIDTVSGQNLVTFTRSSTGTYVDSDGLIKTASVDTPRFDHNPLTGVCNGLLIEEQRTNVVPPSIDFSSVLYDKSGVTIDSNVIIAPDGTVTASFLKENSTTGLHRLQIGVNLYNITTGEYYTHSLFVKPGSVTQVGLGFRDGGLVVFDLISKQATLVTPINQATNTSNNIQELPNGWFRISSTILALGNYGRRGEIFLCKSNTSSYSGNAGDGLYIWGFQVEAGSFPTSYIPTAGSAVTRSADVASITGTNFSRWYNNTEGTAFVQTRNINSVDYSQAPFIGFDGSGGVWNNVQEWGVRYRDSSITFETAVCDSSGFSSALYNNQDARSSAKVAMGLNTTSVALSVNGNIQQVSRTGGTMPSINSLLWHSNNNPKQSTQFSRFTYYPTRLQDFQLQQLTK